MTNLIELTTRLHTLNLLNSCLVRINNPHAIIEMKTEINTHRAKLDHDLRSYGLECHFIDSYDQWLIGEIG